MPLSPQTLSNILTLSLASPRALPVYAYGTSGFRGVAKTLDSVTLRMGMLAAVRSWAASKNAPVTTTSSTHSSTTTTSSTSSSSTSPLVSPIIGLVVTASHNDAPDNGVKLVDPSGEMMDQSWEALATRLANAKEEEVGKVVEAIMAEKGLEKEAQTHLARVFVARDTRDSSPHLRDLVLAGAKALGAEVVDFGLATTPQLHWVVREANSNRTATIAEYYATLARSFQVALECSPRAHHLTGIELTPIVVDCANGVGAISVEALSPLLSKFLSIERRNIGEGGLNSSCGAEHVQKTRSLPISFDAVKDKGKKIASLDGDADRLVYGYVNEAGQFRLMDGDKIIALYTLFLRDLLKEAELDSQLTIGIVQTAYANGASTLYMQNTLGVQVQFTNTGVKHLHHKAVEYDIGVYFESNGHGTVVFSKKAHQLIHAAAHNTQQPPKKHQAARCLQALLDLINQCVGDAVSDMLLVEVALYHRGWHLADWDSVYEDLPSVMTKVKVADRTVITTTDAERKCVTPAGLQAAIDTLVATIPPGSKSTPGMRRAFVRPSGTEDIVRVYAEAATKDECEQLARQVEEVTHKMAGGI